ncbi:hypothetical protein LEP1GSC008_2992 [Leptospira kirschneri serovar Bulgarica str. Nikolaevo]|uniref:Uncharacterized protein n=2 Tax=Leptospira kirschneri TaxID=29507 RepID=A0A0E2B171_9LEPT|nr:hypothetical protein LEP1GSC081_1834 [Leptospira kirschneri str. H1]EMK19983.1 hypothetical protein LEP1GSC008_2992 [Leptospira kirschneri serovar Bulgarica str. Nikolaevo]
MKIYFKKANNPKLEVIFENSISLVKSTVNFYTSEYSIL